MPTTSLRRLISPSSRSLAAMLQAGLEKAAFFSIANAGAVQACFAAGLDAAVTVSLGGRSRKTM